MPFDHRTQEAMIEIRPFRLQAHTLSQITCPDPRGLKRLKDAQHLCHIKHACPCGACCLGKGQREVSTMIERPDEKYRDRLFLFVRKAKIHLTQQCLLEREGNRRSQLPRVARRAILCRIHIIRPMEIVRHPLHVGMLIPQRRHSLLHLKERVLHVGAFELLLQGRSRELQDVNRLSQLCRHGEVLCLLRLLCQPQENSLPSP